MIMTKKSNKISSVNLSKERKEPKASNSKIKYINPLKGSRKLLRSCYRNKENTNDQLLAFGML